MTVKERYSKVLELFASAMPVAETELHYENPFQLLVAVILSAQCTDKRVNLITPALFEAYPTPQALAAATQEEIFEYIRSCSYPNNKSRSLSGMARRLVEDFGGEVPSDLDSLTSLPGVGRKTANVILSVIFDRPTMAVDTHVFRVSERIGLTTGSKTPLATEKALVKYIPEELIPKAHHWLILHGRYVCKARRPDCLNCFLTSVCRFYSKNGCSRTFLFIIEILGTLAFGVSGVRLAAKKHFDWFGAYTLGVITAIGGGTVRDVLLDIPVFWMQTWLYLAVTGVSFLIVLAFTKVLTSDSKSLFMFDAVGLTLFVITGIEKTLAIGYPMWVAIIMGMITGSFGSILRDVLLNEEPLFFRKDIYATACLAGGALYWMTAVFGGPVWLQQSLCVLAILVLRWGALRYGWHLPEMKERTR